MQVQEAHPAAVKALLPKMMMAHTDKAKTPLLRDFAEHVESLEAWFRSLESVEEEDLLD
jgi:hypothetical protein